ncbi:hypothetical protein PPYR_00595 [Photinus pyralis]|uniref:Uncharacterized protein n=2 Tax=Photinus pyralis TaxID=7054 RepID=A0A5N4B216_PHOPY|nr:uncharacterized protein LOC116182519 [Photinus pyralis]KAB0803625.1 hypothetical protein PPYR_00595 [Photinus pyralis]
MFKKTVFCLLIGCLALAKSIEVPDALIDETLSACMKETDIDKAKLSEMFDDDFHIKYPHDVTSKIVECGLGKVHFFNEDGGFNSKFVTEDLAKSLPVFVTDEIDAKKADELAKEIYHECSTPKGENLVEKMANFHNCVMVELKKKTTAA